jgi:hypothetical protein
VSHGLTISRAFCIVFREVSAEPPELESFPPGLTKMSAADTMLTNIRAENRNANAKSAVFYYCCCMNFVLFS